MLKPIVTFFESKLHSRILSIILSYLIAVLPLMVLILLFFNQTRILFGKLPSVKGKLNEVAAQVMYWVDDLFQLDPEATSGWISENFISGLDIPIGVLRESYQSGTTILVNTVLVILITYFMLLYSTAFKNFLLSQVNPKKRKTMEQLFVQIQKLSKRYMIGQGLVIVILGLLIGSGLWLIGVPYPFFWGFLAGFLEIIPYVGTTIGGILPFTYMLVISDTFWQPWAVIGLYIIIQQIEGNIISPNIMGPSIKINPLFIILGLFLGGYIWGISGMILALPILAISKEIFRSFDALVPLSYLMEDGLSRKKDIFLEKFDSDNHRFINLFFKERENET